MFYKFKDESVEVKIKVQPQSNKNQFCGLYGDSLKVKIKAPAVEGEANKELVKFFSKSFKVPKNQIKFLSGERSKTKKLLLPKSEKLMSFLENFIS